MHVKNKHRLKKKDVVILKKQLSELFNGEEFIKKEDTVEIGLVDKKNIIFVNGSPDFFKENESIFFTLVGLLNRNPKHKKVTVDMGAIPYVTNGADIMAPGIVDSDSSIKQGEYVWICDEKHGKPLAIGIALMSGEDMKNQDKGKAVKNIHYIGDSLWKLITEE
ncbi:MAG: RNA-binding protein [Thermoplasmata archaeon]|nr:MAG: RNA-binding protein [Thermoplasmata archaeon]